MDFLSGDVAPYGMPFWDATGFSWPNYSPSASLKIKTAPTDLPVSLDDAKKHLRVEDSDSDDLIAAYIGAAVDSLAYIGITFAPTTYTLDLSGFPHEIILPRPPLKSVTSIQAKDSAGNISTVSQSLYVVQMPDRKPATICLAYSQSWPSVRGDLGSVSIEYVAGYDALPAGLKAAILLIVGKLFDNRSDALPMSLYALPGGVESLVAPFRVF